MNEDYYEQVNDYLENRLTELEKEAFENEMKRDSDLKLTTEYFPEAMEALEAVVQEEARQALRSVHAKDLKHERGARIIPININRRLLFKYAGAAVILLLVCFPVWRLVDKDTPEQIYATYYESYPNLESNQRSGIVESVVETTRIEAYKSYGKQDYKLFIGLIETLPQNYSKANNDLFYLGIAYLEGAYWRKAVTSFEEVSKSNSLYADAARWYLGLAYLKTDQCDKAQMIFTSLRDTGLDKAAASRKILKKLNCSE